MAKSFSASVKALSVILIVMMVAGAFPSVALADDGSISVLDIGTGTAIGHEMAVTEITVPAVNDLVDTVAMAPEPIRTNAFIQLSIPVSLGWNLISFPQTVNSTAITAVLDDCGGNTAWNLVKWYNPLTPMDPWKSYRVGGTANDLATVDCGMGIWVRITAVGTDSALVVEGTTPSTTAIPLTAGWNLVGYPALEPKTAQIALSGIPCDRMSVYNGASASLIEDFTDLSAVTMEAGYGYWLHVTSDCVWNVGDVTPPTFAGLVSAVDSPTDGAVDLTWNAASDPSYPIIYNVYISTTSGGQNFAAPTYTTGQTTAQVTGLTNGQIYYFVVRAEDSAGNEDTNTVQRSATPTVPDLIHPYITITSPVDGTTGIAIDQNIVITFSESINTASFAYSCVPSVAGWSAVWSTVSQTNDRVTLSHNVFAYSTAYTFTVTVANDLAGNALVAGPVANPWTFTTGTLPDTVPPQVVSNSPASGATGVAIGTNVVVVFTEAMNKVNTQGAFSSVPAIAGAFTWNAGSDTMTFNPTSDLAYNTLYTFTILVAATDLAGNTLDGDKDGTMEGDNKDKWVFSFTTGAAPDLTGPTIISTTPANAATGVTITQSVIITFSETINTGSLAYSSAPNPGGWSATWSTVTYTNDRVTLTHTSFVYSTAYTITVTAANDIAGNALTAGAAPNPWTFTTQANPDATGPIVSGVTATPNPVAQGATLTLTASVSDVTTGNNNVAQAEWSRGTSAAAAGSGTAMSASDGTFNSPTEGVTSSISTTGWTEGANTLWVRGRDSVGNWGSAVSTSVTVTVPDTVPPQVTTNTPTNGATGVLVTANIVVDFSEAMNKVNTQGAFSTVPAAAGVFSWNAGGDIMTLNPTADLAANTLYTVTILVAATDLAGNTLDGDKDGVMEADNKDKWVFSFTTAGSASISRYAVCVGINKYDYQNDLTYCVNDAGECRTNLLGAGYSVNLITDGQATKVAMLAALTAMGTSEIAGDYTAFTYSGHGGTSGGVYFICPEDCYYIEDMISDDEMDAIFDTYQSTHQLLFFDSCNSGGLGLGQSGRLHIMAAAANQYSWDGQPDIANGVWTYFFWEAGYRNGGAGSTVLETVFTYSKPLASAYVDTNYPGYTMTPQISDGYTGSFYL
ncbi:MAG: Ig-like domain-containing protein [Thermoplasmata archaeon]|nr:Ig-like domain-containing protein [Thermoplasmata archaeon]